MKFYQKIDHSMDYVIKRLDFLLKISNLQEIKMKSKTV